MGPPGFTHDRRCRATMLSNGPSDQPTSRGHGPVARQFYEGIAGTERGARVTGAALPVPRSAAVAVSAYIPLIVLAVVLAGCAFRIVAAERLTPHVDEAASVLAAHAVAERGVPVLPSGTVYFQGATLSYLLAPFVWLGYGDLSDLVVMRSVSVIAGTIAVYLVYRLGVAATGANRVGILAALFVAMDPLSVQWSGHVRMYGLLQALTIAFVWLLIATVAAPSPRQFLGLVAVFWAAIFTHIEFALLWPVIALVGLLVWRASSRRDRWRWVMALATTALAPVTLLVLNGILGSASVNTGAAKHASPIGFVGDHLLAPLALIRNLRHDIDFSLMLHMNNIVWYVPGIVVALATVVAAWCWRRLADNHAGRRQRLNVAILLACYWVPITGVGLFSKSPKERYLLHVHLIGYVLLAAAIAGWVGNGRGGWRRSGVGALVIAMLAVGLGWRLDDPVVHADHVAATEYVADHRQDDELVIVALPAVAGLLLDDQHQLYFLAGSQNRSRAERLTRTTDAGLVDYWMGVPAIVSAERLDTLLRENPGAWLVVDRDRLAADWAYRGEIAETIEMRTEPVFEAAGGALVLRVPPERPPV